MASLVNQWRKGWRYSEVLLTTLLESFHKDASTSNSAPAELRYMLGYYHVLHA